MKIEATHPSAIRAGKEFPKQLQQVHNGTIVLRDTAVYRSNGTTHPEHKIDVACTVCRHEWEASTFSLVVKGYGCPECFRQTTNNIVGVRRRKASTPEERQKARDLRLVYL